MGEEPPGCTDSHERACVSREDIRDDVDSYGIDLTRLVPKYKEVAIFTSTFNLGECDLMVRPISL
jgi:hypothetical protein